MYDKLYAWALVLLVTVCPAAVLAQTNSLGGDVSADTRAVIVSSLLSQAVAFEHGEGVDKDAAKAHDLYCQAARLGDAEALYSLGWMYANGRGVGRNEAYAATLIALAADKGHAAAESARRYFTAPTGEQPDCLIAKQSVPVNKSTEEQEVATQDSPDLDEFISGLPPEKQRIAELVRMLAGQYGILPRFALAIAVTESNLDIMARSPKGALGVMQLMPDTAARFGVTKVFDPGKNIRGGLAYLRWLLSYYRGDVLLVAAAYNAGEGAVDRNRGIPPYLETVVYVKKILSFFRQASHPFDANLVEASSAVVKQTKMVTR